MVYFYRKFFSVSSWKFAFKALNVILLCFLFAPRVQALLSDVNFPITGFANDVGIQAFEPQFVAFMKKWHVPGASLVVMKNGQIVVEKGYGWSDKEAGNPVEKNAIFRIASVSKTLTAVTILKLIQEGKLSLHDRVFAILNDLQPLNGKRVNPQIYAITIQNLLQMSSGWFNGNAGHFDPLFGPWPKKMANVLNPELPASCETTARFMMSQPLRHQPGTHYAYSNFDYCLLGLIINKVSGSDYGYSGYERYVRKKTLSPLGISDMQIGSTQLKYRLPGEVRYYQDPSNRNFQELANSYYLPYSKTELLRKNFANGGWLGTPQDLATFIQALHHGQILNNQLLDVMRQKPMFVPKNKQSYYTMGGIVYNVGEQRYWIQTGSFTGTNAMIVTKPNGTTIAIIFNYRPEAYAFLTRFRPELRKLMINNAF